MQVGPRPPRGGSVSALQERRESRRRYKTTLLRMFLSFIRDNPNETFESPLIEDNLFQNVYTLLRRQLNYPARYQFEARRFDFDAEGNNGIDFVNIGLFSDEAFWKFFHVSRSTMNYIVYQLEQSKPIVNHAFTTSTDVRGLAANVPLKKTIMLTLWYLRNRKNHLSEARNLFSLQSYELVEAVLERGLQLIIALRNKGLLFLPGIREFEDTANYFYYKHSLRNIMGVLCHEIFVNGKGKRTLLQAVVNEKNMYVIAETSFDTTIRAPFGVEENSVRTLNSVPQCFRLAADIEYKSVRAPRSFVQIVTPYIGSSNDLTPDKVEYNKHFQAILSYGYNTLHYTVKRFPRITCLDKSKPEAVIAACVLHNYCQVLDDQGILLNN